MARETFHGNVVDASDFVTGLYKFKVATHKACLDYLKRQCPRLEEYMRENAPWKDRTGEARKQLNAHTDTDNAAGGMTEIRITLESPVVNSRGQEYGGFLEDGTSHARPYPILEPTLRLKAPLVFNGIRGILDKRVVLDDSGEGY